VTDIHFVEALTLQPGDRVLLRVDPQHVSQEVTERLGQLLNERYPDVEFTVLAVPGQAVVMPREE